jgi:predicted alpha/beta hydrolase
MATRRTDYTITATNGEPLNGTRHITEGNDHPHGAVLLVPAMATPAKHYYPMADWFTARGYVVHTFDYQGYGASARTPLGEVEADILTWAEDATVMVDHVADVESPLPLHWVGHSLGGQLLAFTDHSKLTQATIMCSGTGYWKLSEGRNRVLAPALWYAIAPISVRMCGYFPGRRLKILGDLPAPVMKQWASWCKQPDYAFGIHPEFADRFAQVRIPLTSISFTDDETMSARATAHLESWYSGAQLHTRRFDPRQLGASHITHMGPIKRRNADIWPTIFSHMDTAA